MHSRNDNSDGFASASEADSCIGWVAFFSRFSFAAGCVVGSQWSVEPLYQIVTEARLTLLTNLKRIFHYFLTKYYPYEIFVIAASEAKA